jgi:two-component system phosphate regulon response regulator PhoB
MNISEPELDVILVDDEPRVASALAFATEGTEVRLRAVNDAEHLWQELAANLPSVILLDLQLKDHSGLDLCVELRARPDTAKLPILALSGFTDPKVKDSAFNAGFDDYIVKPFSPEELLVRIRAHARRAGQEGQR